MGPISPVCAPTRATFLLTELWDAVENLLPKEPLLLSEVKAGQKQCGAAGEQGLQQPGCRADGGSSRKGETLQGAQVLQHCSPLTAGTGRAAAQLTPPSPPLRQGGGLAKQE